VLRAALRETARLRGRLDLVVWPEDVVSMGTEQFVGSAVEKALARLARQHRATLLAGVTEDVGTARFKNEVVAFSPRGRLVATFEKVHRVPFGEYVPFRALVRHLANLSDVPRDAIAGHGSGMIHTPAGRLALLVSYEVFFADRARSGVRAGGRLLVVPTNTSSYSSQQAPSQELAASRLQALSFGRYLLQAAPTGYSAVVAPSGAVIAESALSRPAVIERRVSLLSGVTPYEAAGDMPVLAAGGALLVAGWILLLATEDPPPSSTPRFADLRRSPRRRRRRRR
jgi:apolipoprotein N-acyltransferase